MNFHALFTNPAFVAPFFSILSVGIVKLFEYFVLGKNLKVTDAEKYKVDLKADVERLEKQVNEAYAKMGEWRERYYKEVESALALKTENSDLKNALKIMSAENETIKKENKHLSEEVSRMKEDLKLVKQTAQNLERKVDLNDTVNQKKPR